MATKLVVIESYDGNDETGELSITEGEILIMIEKHDSGWINAQKQSDSTTGWVSEHHVTAAPVYNNNNNNNYNQSVPTVPSRRSVPTISRIQTQQYNNNYNKRVAQQQQKQQQQQNNKSNTAAPPPIPKKPQHVIDQLAQVKATVDRPALPSRKQSLDASRRHTMQFGKKSSVNKEEMFTKLARQTVQQEKEREQLFMSKLSVAQSTLFEAKEVKDSQLIHSVSIAAFDLTAGNTLTDTFPDGINFSADEKEHLASLCFPEGAHLHDVDWTYIILKPGELQLMEDGKVLYGMGLYYSHRNEKYKRGAMQRAMLLLSYKPYFDLFEGFIRVAMMQFWEQDMSFDVAAVLFNIVNRVFMDGIQKHNNLVNLWGIQFPVYVEPFQNDVTFPGASLTQLIKIFKQKTMLIWYALLLRSRVLFSGQNAGAHKVGMCCISSPLLIAPLHGFVNSIFPYVPITDFSPLSSPHYICAVTNPLFEERKELFDICCSLTTLKVTTNTTAKKLDRQDKSFIDRVIDSIKNGSGNEQWIRQQFLNYTTAFLMKANSSNSGSGKIDQKIVQRWKNDNSFIQLTNSFK